jgi:hypothetical protein
LSTFLESFWSSELPEKLATKLYFQQSRTSLSCFSKLSKFFLQTSLKGLRTTWSGIVKETTPLLWYQFSVLVTSLVAVTEYLREQFKEKVIPAHGFREFSPWFCVSGPIVRPTIMAAGKCAEGSCPPHGGQKSENRTRRSQE